LITPNFLNEDSMDHGEMPVYDLVEVNILSYFAAPTTATSNSLNAFTIPIVHYYTLDNPGTTNPTVLEFDAFGVWDENDPISYQL